MSAGAQRLHGHYYDGRHPLAIAATLLLGAQETVLIGERVGGRYPTRELRVSPDTGSADRFIALPDGGQFQCARNPLLDSLPHEVFSEGWVAWLERHVAAAIGAMVLVLLLLAAGYKYGLPAAADAIAARIPIETEKALGAHALTWLDEHEWFTPTELDEQTQTALTEGFAKLGAGLPTAAHLRLEFRGAPGLGANALALPGGVIVITDEMVEKTETLEEALAVLAHEIGHIERRHTMRHLLQDSAVALVIATATADAASLSAAVAGLPVLLAQTSYSRAFETEADTFAFALLKQHGISPDEFANLMERLAADSEETERQFAFVSTHPVTAERVKQARTAAR